MGRVRVGGGGITEGLLALNLAFQGNLMFTKLLFYLPSLLFVRSECLDLGKPPFTAQNANILAILHHCRFT